MSVLLEVCCGSVEEALSAARAGADRLELCLGLPTGGVTCSLGMLEEVRANCDLPVVAMVRPKEGRADPPLSDHRAAVRDVARLVAAGADELIVGELDASGRVSRDRNRALLEAADGRPVVFHRVFDMTPDLDEALETLVELGFSRVLTSGGEADVDLGLHGLARLVERSAGRLTILAGGGVRAHNAARCVQVGCTELHFSMRIRTEVLGYGGVEVSEPDPGRVAEVRAALAVKPANP